MGEVYRADDLRLGQAVALKFLPERWAAEPAALSRLLDEVKIARQVSHPNVCRVYDVVESAEERKERREERRESRDQRGERGQGGVTFISMEYIDGEDLASLLRRIGGLPEAKGVQIARQLCAGLAAAHERGVLHRDLKPANIMIDGRGHARIMDFGLAGVAADLNGGGHRAGTPAYMAPEQLERGEVSARSDVYALGLVLYEIFAGQPAFFGATVADVTAQRARGAPTLSRLAPDISPAIERTIFRCLERDPAERPASALMVAAGLPGGDPLAAAVAAGETPSPELLAAAGATAGLRPGLALLGLAAALLLIGLAGWLSGRSLVYQVPLEKPPEVLAEAARGVIAAMGGAALPVEVARGFEVREDMMAWAVEQERVEELRSAIGAARPAGVMFWYRQSPAYFDPPPGLVRVTFDEPPLRPGMAGVRLDTLGRLVEFVAWPADEVEAEAAADEGGDDAAAGDSGESGLDWGPAFVAAGLDGGVFAVVKPERLPAVPFDGRWAWEKAGAGGLSDVRIEAASRLGRPVWFAVMGPWSTAESAEEETIDEVRATARLVKWIALAVVMPFVLAPVVFSVYLARRNIRAGRGDARGAFRIAVMVFATQVLVWILSADHGTAGVEYNRVYTVIAAALTEAALVWVVYLAIEPYARRRWPGMLVSWMRLGSGRWGDGLVGRDLVLGAGLGAAAAVVILASSPIAAWREGVAAPPTPVDVGLLSLGPALGSVFESLLTAIGYPLLGLAIMLMLGAASWWRWVSVAGFGALSLALGFTFSLAVPGLGNAYGSGVVAPEHLVVAAGLTAGTYVVLWRLGLLVAVGAWYTASLIVGSPAGLDAGVWFGAPAMLPLLVPAAAAVWGAVAMVKGRELVREEMLIGTTRVSRGVGGEQVMVYHHR
jgi:hypothetical protein